MRKGTQFFLIFFSIIIFCVAFFLISFYISFQTPHKDIVSNFSKEFNVSENLVYSIMKAESKFDENVVSSAGAVGLMQLLPSTAKYVAEMLNENFKIEDLKKPEINIKFGIKYLSYLSEKFENENLIICAYNAGETVVREWINNEEYFKGGNLINIPFKETKNYLKKVQNNKQIYSIILKSNKN